MLHRISAGKFVIDARGLRGIADVSQVFKLSKEAAEDGIRRLVYVADSFGDGNPEGRVASAAIEGLAKSLSKEVGRKGGTVNALWVPAGVDADTCATRFPSVGWFMQDRRFTFVTGQSIAVAGPSATAYAEPSLIDKRVVVTGASGGIGREVAERCERLGAEQVLHVDVRPPAEAPTSFLELDLADPSAGFCAAAAAKIAEACDGRVDGVVHCAGVTLDKTLRNMPPESWDTSLRVNLFNPVGLTACLGEQGALGEGAAAVALSSIIGISGNRGQTHYAAGKRGLREWAAAQTKLRAYAVAPGYIRTPMTAAMPAEILASGAGQSALERLGEPEEVADVVATLLTPLGAHVTSGQTLRVCGGNFWG